MTIEAAKMHPAGDMAVEDKAATIVEAVREAELPSRTSHFILSQDGTLSAHQMRALAELGETPSRAGHSLICADNAANLAGLSASALALSEGTRLNESAIVNASMAASLAALPNFQLAQGVSLTIQDEAANLIALGAGAPAGTSIQRLAPGNAVTLNATQAAALARLPHFEAQDARITVRDTLAALSEARHAGWHAIATSVMVVDHADALAAHEGMALIQDAAQVILAGNATVPAPVAARLALIPGFSTGGHTLTVFDHAAAIAAHADAMLAIASAVVVSDRGPLSADAADELALVAASGKLHFAEAAPLIVRDDYASLTSPGNAAGLALAGRIELVDHAAHIAADLSLGAHSVLLAHAPSIASISVNDGAPLMLSASALLTPGMDDGPGALLHKLTGAELVVTEASVDQLAALAALDVKPSTIMVRDSAANLSADLESGHSLLVSGLAGIASIDVSDGLTLALSSGEHGAPADMAHGLTMQGDDTVSATTILRLSDVPHFSTSHSELIMASTDFTDGPTLKATADLGYAFPDGEHALSLGSDVLQLAPHEFLPFQPDDIAALGHLSDSITGDPAARPSNGAAQTTMAGATVDIHGPDGASVSGNTEMPPHFVLKLPDGPEDGPAMTLAATAHVMHETPGTNLVILDAGSVENTVAQLGGSFASSGAILVDAGKYLNLYASGAVPQNMTTASLVYDPTAHTISLDVPGQSPVMLITLGGTTHPANLEASEIFFKHHG